MQKNKRLAAEQRGRRAEWMAALWLMLKGYRLLARRARTPLGEIDLIMQRGDLIAMIEVKARTTLDEAVFAVTPRMQERIARAATLWLAHSGGLAYQQVRYDIVALAPRSLPRHVPGAWWPQS